MKTLLAITSAHSISTRGVPNGGITMCDNGHPRCAFRNRMAGRPIGVLVGAVLVTTLGLPRAATAQADTYVGGFGGLSRVDNQIVDVDGFANWGHPGAVLDYDNVRFVGGGLIGQKFTSGGVPLRIEFAGTFGDLSAKTTTLDPVGLDETAASTVRWITTVRAGVEQAIDGATVFVTGGLATAGITNSVTDIDFGPDRPPEVDRDDSFRDSATEVGWVIGGGVETPLAEAWHLRIEGSYLDFGRGAHSVNHSGNNRCGPGNPQRPCWYNVENTLGIVRWTIIYRFGR